MRILRVIAPAILMLSIWVGVSTQGVFAAPAGNEGTDVPEEIGIACDGGVCSLEVGLGGVQAPALAGYGASLAFEALQKNVDFLPDDAGIELSDKLVIKMPVGDLKLVDARLTLDRGDEPGSPRMRGTAEIPFPTFGVLDDAHVITPARADIGMDQGRNLLHLGAPLDPERTYLFFNFGAGLDMTAQLDGAGAQQIGISIPKGQSATLIVDPQQPFAYLSGDITLSFSDQIAFIGETIGTDISLLALPDQLPLAQRVSLHVEGAFTDKLEDAYLELGGGYALTGGLVGNWLGLELEPLAAQGLLQLNTDGVLLTGLAASSIQPRYLLDGALETRVFVPFSTEMEEAYMEWTARGSVPLVGLHAEGKARLDGAMDLVTDGSLRSPFSRDETGAEVVMGSSDGNNVVQTLSTLAALTASQAGDGYGQAAEAAGNSYQWLADGLCSLASSGCDAVETPAVADAGMNGASAGD